MEVISLSENSIKIKGKNASFVIDPAQAMKKISADAVLMLEETDPDLAKVEDFRVVIKGSGEYEVGGVRISVTEVSNKFTYSLSVDNIGIFLGRTSVIDKASEGRSYGLLILNVDSNINPTIVTSFEPNVVILYGDRAKDEARAFGKQDIEEVSKFSISSDKLPTEMKVVLLRQE